MKRETFDGAYHMKLSELRKKGHDVQRFKKIIRTLRMDKIERDIKGIYYMCGLIMISQIIIIMYNVILLFINWG